MQVSGLRYYSPSLGRWVSRDPIREFGGQGLYVHVVNRPATVLDLLGLVALYVVPEDERQLQPIFASSPGVNGETHVNGHSSWRVQIDSVERTRRMVECTCAQGLPLPVPFPWPTPPAGFVSMMNCQLRVTMTALLKDRRADTNAGVQEMFAAYGHEQRHVRNHLKVIMDQMVPYLENVEARPLRCCPPQARIDAIEDHAIEMFTDSIQLEVSHDGSPFFGNRFQTFTPSITEGTSTGIIAQLEGP